MTKKDKSSELLNSGLFDSPSAPQFAKGGYNSQLAPVYAPIVTKFRNKLTLLKAYYLNGIVDIVK